MHLKIKINKRIEKMQISRDTSWANKAFTVFLSLVSGTYNRVKSICRLVNIHTYILIHINILQYKHTSNYILIFFMLFSHTYSKLSINLMYAHVAVLPVLRVLEYAGLRQKPLKLLSHDAE
jgi:hypothetical protein